MVLAPVTRRRSPFLSRRVLKGGYIVVGITRRGSDHAVLYRHNKVVYNNGAPLKRWKSILVIR